MTPHERTRKRSTIAGKQCAPRRGDSGTCFTMQELRHIAKQFNQTLQARAGTRKREGGVDGIHKIISPIAISKYRSKRGLWTEIDTRMQATSSCSTELCWAKQDSETASYSSAAFRPGMPHSWKTNHTAWLSTSDIQRVMQQYEKAYKGFHFVGAVPVDFASPHDNGQIGMCVVQALCNVRIQQWSTRGIDQVGIVYNLDAHDEPGSHWVSSFIDIEACKVYYYDSFGAEPPYEIHKFLTNMASQLADFHGARCEVQTNNYRHQFRNTECGIYSMYFIATMLEGAQSYTDFVQNGLNDTQMNKYRQVFYNTLERHENTEESGGGVVGGGRERRRSTKAKTSSPSRRHTRRRNHKQRQ